MTLKPAAKLENTAHDDDEISPAPPVQLVQDDHAHLDHKHIGEVSMMQGINHQATQ
jgi:hypothetical protein